jgi:hypothetical protein
MNNQLFYPFIIISLIIIIISLYFYHTNLLSLYIIAYFGIFINIISIIFDNILSKKTVKNLYRLIIFLYVIMYLYYGLNINNKIFQIFILSSIGLILLSYIFSKILKKFIINENILTNIQIINHCIILFPFLFIVIYQYFERKSTY